MDEHFGREKYERSNEHDDINYRNGHSNKSIKSSYREVPIDVPKDRNTHFEPRSIKKYEKDCNELDKKIIGLYARGMSTRDIQSELEELYGIDVSSSMISKITDKVMCAAVEWQNRMLDPVYPIVYMDVVHFKVMDEHRIVTKAAYICIGIDIDGYKDILGIWIGEAKGTKFWLSVCNDLSNRGVKYVWRGLPDAVKAVFPKAYIQNCLIHQIRNSIKYISYKNRKEFMRDLKLVYKADT